MTVAIAPARDRDLADFLMVAGVAIRHGLSPEGALSAVTLNAAKILGVADRVGSLVVGKDADFCVLSGEPFAVGTMVEQTWVDGELAFERDAVEDVIAVRAGRVLTGTGETIRDGVVVIADGKIRAIGENLAVPYGARMLDLGDDAVITPGFVDASCSLGLSGDGTGIPGGTPDQVVAAALSADDPTFEPVRRAGVTTVLTSGRDGGLVSGRVAAIKTGATDRDSMVLDDTAAQRFVFDGVERDSVNALKAQFERGKKYKKAWDDYAKALADWEAGKKAEKKKKKPEEPEEEDESAEDTDPVSGTWECTLEGLPIPVEVSMILVLKLEGEEVTGTANLEIPPPGPGKLPPADCTGTFADGTLKLEITLFGETGTVEATVKDDTLDGEVSGGGQTAQISGRRTSKDTTGAAAASSSGKDDDDKPKKPKVDEKLEPIKAILEGHATAIVRTKRAPAIRAVVELMKAEKLKYALHGADDAVDTPDLLGDEPPAVVLGPRIVKRERGEMINTAANLVAAEVPIALSTGDVTGSRYLPLHAAHAIRYGLDPQSAMAALTIEPARMFGIDDRVGSLHRGKDADLVVFSGSPFELTSRVLLVVCNGRVVHDSRTDKP